MNHSLRHFKQNWGFGFVLYSFGGKKGQEQCAKEI